MKDQLPQCIELINENNEIETFEYVMALDYRNREYVALAPAGGDAGSADEEGIVILRVEQDDNGEDYYAGIEDEKELEEVFTAVSENYDE